MKKRHVLISVINKSALLVALCFSYGGLYLLLLRPVAKSPAVVSLGPIATHTVMRPNYAGHDASRFVHSTLNFVFEPASRIDQRIRPDFWRRPVVWTRVVNVQDFLSPQTTKAIEDYTIRQNSQRYETTNNDL